MKRLRLREDLPSPEQEEQLVEESSAIDLLEKIRSGRMSPTLIQSPDRPRIVAFLMAEGYSTPEIAKILKVSDRTIERDRQAIRQGNALEHDPKLADQMSGRLWTEAELAVQQIRKILRDRNTPPAVKVDGNHRCVQIISGLIQDLQRLGYLPTAAQKLDGTITHHLAQLPNLDDMHVEVERLKVISRTILPNDEQTHEKLKQLEDGIERAGLAVQIEELSSDLASAEDPDEQAE